MEHIINIIKIIFLSIVITVQAAIAKDISFSIFEITNIAQKIYLNECSAKVENILYWNDDENFASLGIGHFIWYPKNVEKKFDESFPKLITYIKEHGVIIPPWLDNLKYAPWKNKKEMLDDPKSKLLRELLEQTISLQALFMVDRLNNALPKILDNSNEDRHEKIKKMFDCVAKQENGYYLLIDYVNFKGEGIKKSERYNDKGWGLLQVLQCMQNCSYPKKEFARCAKKILSQRVKNAPKNRDEKRWLKGWFNRIDTYTK